MKKILILCAFLLLVTGTVQAKSYRYRNYTPSSHTTTHSKAPTMTITPPSTPTPILSLSEISLTAYLTSYASGDNDPAGSTGTYINGVSGNAGGIGTYANPITLAVGYIGNVADF